MVSFSLSITISRRPPTTQKAPTTSSSLRKSNTSQSKEKESFIPPSPSRSSLTTYKYQQKYKPTSQPTNNQSETSVLPPHYTYTPRTSSSLPITTYSTHSVDGSFAELLGNQRTPRGLLAVGTKVERRPARKMVDLSHKDFLTSIDGDRRKSYGIGGAGNIRRPSDAIYPLRTNSDGTRRSSVWSVGTSSPEGKRRWSWFGRKNSVSEAEEVNFGDVNLTGGDRETKD